VTGEGSMKLLAIVNQSYQS